MKGSFRVPAPADASPRAQGKRVSTELREVPRTTSLLSSIDHIAQRLFNMPSVTPQRREREDDEESQRSALINSSHNKRQRREASDEESEGDDEVSDLRLHKLGET
jgi:hypothetical protein